MAPELLDIRVHQGRIHIVDTGWGPERDTTDDKASDGRIYFNIGGSNKPELPQPLPRKDRDHIVGARPKSIGTSKIGHLENGRIYFTIRGNEEKGNDVEDQPQMGTGEQTSETMGNHDDSTNTPRPHSVAQKASRPKHAQRARRRGFSIDHAAGYTARERSER